MTESCMKVRFTQFRVIAIFEQNISQGSVATLQGVAEYLLIVLLEI